MAITNQESSTSNAKVLDDDSPRAIIFHNSDANRVYILLGSGTASASNHSFSLAENENARVENHSGEVNAVWAGDGSGFLHVTTL